MCFYHLTIVCCFCFGLGESQIELGDVLNVDNLNNLLDNQDVQARLLSHLPNDGSALPSASDFEKLIVNIQSSQFKSTLKVSL